MFAYTGLLIYTGTLAACSLQNTHLFFSCVIFTFANPSDLITNWLSVLMLETPGCVLSVSLWVLGSPVWKKLANAPV